MINDSSLEQVNASTLLEDLRHNETSVKINAVQNLNVICLALGKERSRTELLPYLSELIDEEDDEFLVELAKKLSEFLNFIGGITHLSKLLAVVELLMCVEEKTVRDEVTYKLIAYCIGY